MWRGALILASACLVVAPGWPLPLSAQTEARAGIEYWERAKSEYWKRFNPSLEGLPPEAIEEARRRLEELALGVPPEERPINTIQDIFFPPVAPSGHHEVQLLGGVPPTIRDRADNSTYEQAVAEGVTVFAFENFAGESLRSPDQVRTTKAWLTELGYYHGPSNSAVGRLTRAAIEDFEAKEGYIFPDALLRAALKRYASLSPRFQLQVRLKIPELLANLGFPQRDRLQEEVVRQYQQFRAIPPTGSIDPETASAINEDLGLLDLMLQTPYSQLSSLALKSGHGFSAYLRDDNKFYFLVRRNTPELWVMNDRGRLENRLAGAEAIDQFHSTGRNIAAKNTSSDRVFLYVKPQDANGTFDLQVGSQRLFLARDEFTSLLQSPQAPSQLDKAFDFGGATKPTVVVSGGDDSATAVVGLLKARYGRTADVFLARDPYAASKHLEALASLSVRSPSDLMVYTAKNITDYGTIANLKKRLANAGIRVVEEKDGSISERWLALSREKWPGSNVIVIAGHRDSTMASHLINLKEAGALRGKLVVVPSCYEPGVELLQSDLTAGYLGATGVIFFQETIKASAVEAVMLELIKLMRSGSFDPARIDDLLERSVDRALEHADTPSEREEIEKLRHRIFQITRLRFLSMPSDADA